MNTNTTMHTYTNTLLKVHGYAQRVNFRCKRATIFCLCFFLCSKEYGCGARGGASTNIHHHIRVYTYTCVFVGSVSAQRVEVYGVRLVRRGVMRVNNSRKWKRYYCGCCCCMSLLYSRFVGLCVLRSAQLQNRKLRFWCLIRIKSCLLLSKQHQKKKIKGKYNM